MGEKIALRHFPIPYLSLPFSPTPSILAFQGKAGHPVSFGGPTFSGPDGHSNVSEHFHFQTPNKVVKENSHNAVWTEAAWNETWLPMWEKKPIRVLCLIWDCEIFTFISCRTEIKNKILFGQYFLSLNVKVLKACNSSIRCVFSELSTTPWSRDEYSVVVFLCILGLDY